MSLQYFKNTGISDIDFAEDEFSILFPKGAGKAACIYPDFSGVLKQNDTVKVGGSAYREGLQGGRILNSNLPWYQLTAESDAAAQCSHIQGATRRLSREVLQLILIQN